MLYLLNEGSLPVAGVASDDYQSVEAFQDGACEFCIKSCLDIRGPSHVVHPSCAFVGAARLARKLKELSNHGVYVWRVRCEQPPKTGRQCSRSWQRRRRQYSL